MFKLRRGFLETFKVPRSVSRGPEKDTPHIVIDTDYLMALTVEVLHSLRADKPTAAGHQNGAFVCHEVDETSRALVAVGRRLASMMISWTRVTSSLGTATKFPSYSNCSGSISSIFPF